MKKFLVKAAERNVIEVNILIPGFFNLLEFQLLVL